MAARQCGQGPRPGRRPVPPPGAGRVAWAAALQLAPDFVRTRNREALSASLTGTMAWAGREGAVAGAGQERQSRTLPTPSSRGNDCIGSPHVGQRGSAELARPDSMPKPPRPTLACRGETLSQDLSHREARTRLSPQRGGALRPFAAPALSPSLSLRPFAGFRASRLRPWLRAGLGPWDPDGSESRTRSRFGWGRRCRRRSRRWTRRTDRHSPGCAIRRRSRGPPGRAE